MAPEGGDSLRERKKKRARLELAHTAMRLFAEKGFEATTVEEIATIAEYAPSTFFRHFAAKEDVAFVGVDEYLAEFRDALAHRPAGVELWAHIQEHLLRTLWRFSEPGPDLEVASMTAWLTEPAFAAPYRRFCADWEQVIADAWAAEQGSPDSGTDATTDMDAQVVARQIVGAIEACFAVHVRTGTDTSTLFKQAAHRLDRGLGQHASD